MDWYAQQRMRANLVKAIACIVLGLATVLLVELAWDAGPAGGHAEAGEGAVRQLELADRMPYGRVALAAFALEDDDGAVGATTAIPPDFIAECFSPSMAGEARCTEDGSVIGIVSQLPPADLFALCSDALQAHGWLQVESGQASRSSFVKDVGLYRWLYLDVTSMADASTAVVIVKEGE